MRVSFGEKISAKIKSSEARFKIEARLKYGWFQLNLYTMFQDLSRRSIETGFWVDLDATQIL